ncbi:MAG: ABC transporter permease [Pseudomonadota bacterium]
MALIPRIVRAWHQFSALLAARNREFWRDRSALGWSLAFPAFVIVGLYFAFADDNQALYKVALVDATPADARQADPALARFLDLQHVEFIVVHAVDEAQHKIARHQLDLLVDPGDATAPTRYWVNTDSPNGYILEQLLLGSEAAPRALRRETLSGAEVRYVDWVIPGVIGMNMMFGCLWGVGYVIVRYRANGVLRRFRATPVSAFTFLSAQVVSRLFITLAITSLIFFPSWWLLGFRVEGSLADLLVVTVFGALSMIAMGLVTATRTASIEVSGGVLNFLTWPMMLLSGVWFSLEGADPWIHTLAALLPLTHFVDGARAVMIDGATLASLWPQLAAMTAMTVVFMTLSAATFRWER